MQKRKIENINLWMVQTPQQYFLIEEDALSGKPVRFEQKNKSDVLNLDTTGYQNVKIFIVPTSFTLLPSALFLEEHKKEYLSFTTDLTPNDIIEVDTIPYHKVKIIWSLDANDKSKITNAFPNGIFYSIFKPLIEHTESFKGKNKILSLFLGEILLFIVVKDRTLQVVNYFDIQSIEDALYYHLLMLQSLEVDENNVNLIPLGISPYKKQFIERAEDYFSQIHKGELTEEQELLKSIKL